MPKSFMSYYYFFNRSNFLLNIVSFKQLRLFYKNSYSSFFFNNDLRFFINLEYYSNTINFIEKKRLNFFLYNNINNLDYKFPVNILNYFKYVKELLNDPSSLFGINVKFISNNLLPYGNKLVRVKSRDHIKSFLYGFKFHFVGRFTRKQQSASM